MRKLYAQEDREQDDPLKTPELLIDKVMQYEKKSKEGVSVTADLLKQRHELRKEITDQLESQEEESEDNDSEESSQSDDDQDSSSDSEEKGEEESSSQDSEDDTDKDDVDKQEDKSDKEDKKDDDEDKGKPTSSGKDPDESDESAAADDPDDLRKLVGAGNTATESLITKPHAPSPSRRPARVSSESLSSLGTYTLLKNLFEPLRQSHLRHRLAVEGYGLKSSAKSTEQPLAYVKEEVAQSLSSLIKLANQYIHKNQATITQASTGLKTIGEQLTLYREYFKAEKFSFTQQLVQDPELIRLLSVKNKSEVEYTSSVLVRYLENSSAMAVKILQNPFEQLAEAFHSHDYQDQATGEMVRTELLPGFVQMHATAVPFSNYIDTNYEEYQVYKRETYSPQDLYNLNAISLDEDPAYKKYLNELDKILISTGMVIDNLQMVNDQYQQFIAEVKTIAYDVEKGVQTELAGLGLDDKLKDFIKFKMVTELYLNDLDNAVQYLTASLSVLTKLIKLSGQ